MTVSSLGVVVSFTGNGVATIFPYTFEIPLAADVAVYLTNLTTGVRTDLTPTQYSISGLGSPAGGNVTYNPAAGPLPAGYRITIERVIALLQTSVIPDQGALFASTVEDALDREVMMMQAIAALQSRTVRAPMSDNPLSDLPNATLRALKTLGFDANGDVLVGSVSTAAIAAAILPIVQSATLAAMFTAMGFVFGSTVWDPGNCANGAQVSTTFAVAGVGIGDLVVSVSGSGALLAGALRGQVSAANTLGLVITNNTGGAIDVVSQTFYYLILKKASLGL